MAARIGGCLKFESGRRTRPATCGELFLLLIAPVELADFRRTPLEVPIAAEQPEPRLVGAGDDDVRRNPVFAVADHDVALVAAPHRRDGAVDDLLDLDDARLTLDLVGDRHLA